MNIIYKKIYTIAILSGLSNLYAAEPNFELWNKNPNSIYYSLNNSNFKELAPNKWDSSTIDIAKETQLAISLKDPKTTTEILKYSINPGKTVYARIKTENGTTVFGPQTGPLLGFTGKTERGYSLKNNFKSGDFKTLSPAATQPTTQKTPEVKTETLSKEEQKLRTKSKEELGILLIDLAADNKLAGVEMVIKSGANVNFQDQYGDTALILACEKGFTEVARSLIKLGANVNIKNKDNLTALAFAASENRKDVVSLLISAKANLELTNNHGETPLIIAAQKGNIDIIKSLIQAKANLNAQDTIGKTALMYATFNDHKDIAKLLIQAGANLNLQDKNKETALTLAASRSVLGSSTNNREIIKSLIDAKANLAIKNSSGQTAFDITNKEDIKNMLRTAMGKK